MSASKNKLEITQIRSKIGSKQNQRETLRTLGLKHINDMVVRDNTPSVRGMVSTVHHLVTVKEVDNGG